MNEIDQRQMSYKYKKIMVIDDNEIDRYICDRASRTFRLSEVIVSIESGAEGLAYLQAHVETPDALPELIFLDINMPGMNGFQFLDAYEMLPDLIKKKCIIVMLTSSTHAEDQQRVTANKYVRGYLCKPLTLEKVQAL